MALTGPGSELTHQEDPDSEYGRSKKKRHTSRKNTPTDDEIVAGMFPFFFLLFYLKKKNNSGFFLFLRTAQITKPRKYKLLECKSRHPCTVRNICTIHQKYTSTLLNHQHSSASIPRRARLNSQCLLRKQLAHMLWLYIRQHRNN